MCPSLSTVPKKKKKKEVGGSIWQNQEEFSLVLEFHKPYVCVCVCVCVCVVLEIPEGPKTKKKKKNYSTEYSHVVPHHSTDSAINYLTAQIGRDAVL